MLTRQPIYRALEPNIVGSGLPMDLHPLTRPLWADALNVTFYNGRVKRRVPSILAFDAGAADVRGLAQHQDSNGVRWVWAGCGADVRRWYGPASELAVTMGSYAANETSNVPATQYDLTPYGNFMVINNSEDKVRLFKPAVSVDEITDAPVKAVTYMKKLNFLLAIGTGSAKTRLNWSDADNIDVWTATAENLAGALTVEEFNTPIRAAATLGQSIAVYGEDQLALMTYIGAPFYFGVKMALDGIGAVGKMAVASDGRNNFGVSRGGIWWSDGVSFRYIDDALMREYFQANINWAQASKIVAARNDYTSCIEFAFPMGLSVDINEAWSLDPRNGAWSKIPHFTSKMERKLFDRPIVGYSNGEVHLDQRDPTTTAPLTLKTRPLLMQLQDATGLADTHNNSRVAEVDILFKEATGIEFKISASQNIDMVGSDSGWIAADTDTVTYKMPASLRDGVYYTVEFRSTVTEWALDLQGFLMFGTIEGTKRGAA